MEAMSSRDRTYKSFFMVNFLLYLGFGLERFERSTQDRQWVRRSPPLQNMGLSIDNHTSDENDLSRPKDRSNGILLGKRSTQEQNTALSVDLDQVFHQLMGN